INPLLESIDTPIHKISIEISLKFHTITIFCQEIIIKDPSSSIPEPQEQIIVTPSSLPQNKE
ncbi:40784_t:CDS:2, partial [Gigaspora margarita]